MTHLTNFAIFLCSWYRSTVNILAYWWRDTTYLEYTVICTQMHTFLDSYLIYNYIHFATTFFSLYIFMIFNKLDIHCWGEGKKSLFSMDLLITTQKNWACSETIAALKIKLYKKVYIPSIVHYYFVPLVLQSRCLSPLHSFLTQLIPQNWKKT